MEIETLTMYYRWVDHGKTPDLDMREWTKKERRHSKRWKRKHPRDLWSVCVIAFVDGTGKITKPELIKEGWY